MMDNFIYETPTKVYFGRDEELKVGKLVAAFHPNKVLLHYGGQSAEKSGLLERIRNCLREENVSFTELGGVVPNPELSLVREGIALCIKEHVDFVLAVGGGRFGNVQFLCDYERGDEGKARLRLQLQPYGFCC